MKTENLLNQDVITHIGRFFSAKELCQQATVSTEWNQAINHMPTEFWQKKGYKNKKDYHDQSKEKIDKYGIAIKRIYQSQDNQLKVVILGNDLTTIPMEGNFQLQEFNITTAYLMVIEGEKAINMDAAQRILNANIVMLTPGDDDDLNALLQLANLGIFDNTYKEATIEESKVNRLLFVKDNSIKQEHHEHITAYLDFSEGKTFEHGLMQIIDLIKRMRNTMILADDTEKQIEELLPKKNSCTIS